MFDSRCMRICTWGSRVSGLTLRSGGFPKLSECKRRELGSILASSVVAKTWLGIVLRGRDVMTEPVNRMPRDDRNRNRDRGSECFQEQFLCRIQRIILKAEVNQAIKK